MAVNTISEILGLKTEADLKDAINLYEQSMLCYFKPLTDKLAQQVLTSEVQQLELLT